MDFILFHSITLPFNTYKLVISFHMVEAATSIMADKKSGMNANDKYYQSCNITSWQSFNTIKWHHCKALLCLPL